ncbi:methylamine utilization protein [Alkalimonas sp. MEB108]|uniref:Methylamine utilization protein n=1 Tax=Alkalimonas cellulosilytica TaxID=3058395 RepID=A0ABU7J8A3_9GAMM|nr:methylamine utilization protein [Alkalimonas sp. MEB108]MEE2002773.1 methylamine utilization protein [Alkalimonas sp. MEB108]
MTLSVGWTTLCLLCSFISLNATANSWQFFIQDQDGQPLDDAVVELIPLDHQPSTSLSPTLQATIRQQGLNFVPFVSAVQVGTEVDFPNLDRTRHHVYSFSAAKVFEIQLYHDRPEQPVLFDKAGIVALGCNIHDYMEAYVFISESPLLAVSDKAGLVQFHQLTEGRYQLTIWHPFQQQEWMPKELSYDGGSAQLQFAVEVQHRPKQPTPQRGFGS